MLINKCITYKYYIITYTIICSPSLVQEVLAYTKNPLTLDMFFSALRLDIYHYIAHLQLRLSTVPSEQSALCLQKYQTFSLSKFEYIVSNKQLSIHTIIK